ncbi:hypothetical protein VPH35_053776 [Triticum aestivum]
MPQPPASSVLSSPSIVFCFFRFHLGTSLHLCWGDSAVRLDVQSTGDCACSLVARGSWSDLQCSAILPSALQFASRCVDPSKINCTPSTTIVWSQQVLGSDEPPSHLSPSLWTPFPPTSCTSVAAGGPVSAGRWSRPYAPPPDPRCTLTSASVSLCLYDQLRRFVVYRTHLALPESCCFGLIH